METAAKGELKETLLLAKDATTMGEWLRGPQRADDNDGNDGLML
jgi:hypothetical protein